MFNIDTGPEGTGGPFIAWSARGTQDGEIPAKSFYLRTREGKEPFEAFDTGIILDIHSLKTGWQESSGAVGVAPKWVFGQSPAQLPDKPGEDFKKGFSVRCAIGGGETATWEQAGAGVWGALVDLVPAINSGPVDDKGKLPLVRCTGAELIKFQNGSSTQKPLLEILKWVPRPACLKDGAAAGIDTGEAEQAPPPAAKAAPKPAPAPADAEF